VHYRRILLKLSGEALGCSRKRTNKTVVDSAVVGTIAQAITTVVDTGVQVGLVLGGGNWFRGAQGTAIGIHRMTGDQIGMLATIMNALVMRDALMSSKVDVRILSAIPLAPMVEDFEYKRAQRYLSSGKVVIFTGGTGHPFVSTDSAASLRALEIKADILLKATSVDGIYNEDPIKNPHAKLYNRISYDQVIRDELQVMDLAAFIQCREHQLPIRVFNINTPHSLEDIIEGQSIGTLVCSESMSI
jgi:uridylate kinase